MITTLAQQQDDTPINIYVVPNDMLQADATSLAYGQFYSYKFILGAEGIWNEPRTDACVMGIVQEAIRDALAWAYLNGGESIFRYRYSTQWFIGTVFTRRIARDATFLRCLRRVFDHYTETGLENLKDLYGRALRELRLAGQLADGPGREGLWTLNPESISGWAKSSCVTDGQVADGFWEAYECFKQPNGRAASQAKKAMIHSWPLSYRHDIENRVEDLRRKGRVVLQT